MSDYIEADENPNQAPPQSPQPPQKKGLSGCAIAAIVGGIVFVCFIMIAIISAIAIPSLMKTKMHSNEAATVGALKTIATAQVMYYRDFNQYASNFNQLYAGGSINDDALKEVDVSKMLRQAISIRIKENVFLTTFFTI